MLQFHAARFEFYLEENKWHYKSNDVTLFVSGNCFVFVLVFYSDLKNHYTENANNKGRARRFFDRFFFSSGPLRVLHEIIYSFSSFHVFNADENEYKIFRIFKIYANLSFNIPIYR